MYSVRNIAAAKLLAEWPLGKPSRLLYSLAPTVLQLQDVAGLPSLNIVLVSRACSRTEPGLPSGIKNGHTEMWLAGIDVERSKSTDRVLQKSADEGAGFHMLTRLSRKFWG